MAVQVKRSAQRSSHDQQQVPAAAPCGGQPTRVPVCRVPERTVSSRPCGSAHMAVRPGGSDTLCSSPASVYALSAPACSRHSASPSSRKWHHATCYVGPLISAHLFLHVDLSSVILHDTPCQRASTLRPPARGAAFAALEAAPCTCPGARLIVDAQAENAGSESCASCLGKRKWPQPQERQGERVQQAANL